MTLIRKASFSKYIAHKALFDQCYQCESVVNAVFVQSNSCLSDFRTPPITPSLHRCETAKPTQNNPYTQPSGYGIPLSVDTDPPTVPKWAREYFEQGYA